MQEKVHLDTLVKGWIESASGVVELGQKIAKSKTTIAIIFVDLCNSTLLKRERPPEEWLAYVYSFVEAIQTQAAKTHGSVIKRIGDELMISFDCIEHSENFLSNFQDNRG